MLNFLADTKFSYFTKPDKIVGTRPSNKKDILVNFQALWSEPL